MVRPVILAFVAFYLPGFRGGGPIRTIANMVDQLGADFDFRIVSMDRDLHDRLPYENVQVDGWNEVGKARVFYASTATRSFSGFARLIRETPHDLLYLNSFFDPRFTLRPLLARSLGLAPKRPLVLAPRGEFSAGALSIKSWKKKPFIRLARISGLFDQVTWHASTEMEASDIRRVVSVTARQVRVARKIAVAPDLLQKVASFPDLQKSNAEFTGRSLRVCFLSRIAPMKNLEYALRVLARVNAPIDFNIFGPKEDPAYWGRCQTVIGGLPANIKAMYCGSVDHAEVKRVIGAHDLFFVPSLGENFGHVFMESLSAGVPILVSDQTPWCELQSKGVGWDIPLDQPENFVKAVEEAAQFSSAQRNQMRFNCLDFAHQKAEDSSAVMLNRELFAHALAFAK